MGVKRMEKKKFWFISLGLALTLAGATALFIGLKPSAEERITATQLTTQLEHMYEGKVSELKLEGQEYVAHVQRVDGIYEVRTDTQYGNVLSLTLIQSTEGTEPETTESVVEEKPVEKEEITEPATTRIAQSQAIEIAKSQVSGTVEDVEFEDSETGGYYLVDIEQPPVQSDDDDGAEATVQIHAITGEVISVIWDD